jgi:hypothetical protein
MNKIGNLEKFVLENIGTVVNINNQIYPYKRARR